MPRNYTNYNDEDRAEDDSFGRPRFSSSRRQRGQDRSFEDYDAERDDDLAEGRNDDDSSFDFNDDVRDSNDGFSEKVDWYGRAIDKVNYILDGYFPLKAIFASKDEEDDGPSDYERFRESFLKAFFRENPSEEETIDFVASIAPKISADLGSRASYLMLQDDATREEIDRALDLTLERLYYRAGGTLIGVIPSLLDIEDPNLAKALRGQSADRDDAGYADGSEYRDEDDDRRRGGAVRPKSGPVQSYYSGVRESNADERSNRYVYADSNDRSPGVARGFSSLGAYRRAKKAESNASRKPIEAALVAVGEIMIRFLKGAQIDATNYKKFYRHVLLKFFVKDESGADVDANLRDSLFAPAKNDGFSVIVRQLVARALASSLRTRDSFGFVDVATIVEKLDSVIELDGLSKSALSQIIATVVRSLGAIVDPDLSFDAPGDASFDEEIFEVATYLVKETFANRVFNADYSDFQDFRAAFEATTSPELEFSDERLRELFLKAGGVFKKTDDDSNPGFQLGFRPTSRGEVIKEVVSKGFSNGLDPNSPADLETFRNIAKAFGGEQYFEGETDEKLRKIIARCCILCNDRLYSVTDKDKKDIKANFERYFNIGGSVIYYAEYFLKNRDKLSSLGVGDHVVLSAVAASVLSDYFFYDDYFEKEEDDSSERLKIVKEILRVWGSFSGALNAEEIAAKIVYVDAERVAVALDIHTDLFEASGDGKYVKSASCTQFDNLPSDVVDNPELDALFAKALGAPATLPTALDGKAFLAKLAGNSSSDSEQAPKATAAKPIKKTVEERRSLWDRNVASLLDEQEFDEGGFEEDEEEDSPDDSLSAEVPEVGEESSVIDPGQFSEEYLMNLARILGSFSQGFNLNDADAVDDFRKRARKRGFELIGSDDDIVDQIKRVGYAVDERVFITKKNTLKRLREEADSWFDEGGRIIYYEALFQRCDWLAGSGIPSPEHLRNRLENKCYRDRDAVFYDDYFEREEDDEHTEEQKVKMEIDRVWDGSSSKRMSDLVAALLIPRDKLTEVMEGDSESFAVSSNGYWKRVQKAAPERKRTSVVRKKSARKK